jgi:acyl-phosphate glycerol 3-phosphate acyltransferase
MHTLLIGVFVVLSYLLGSLPFGYWIAKRSKGPEFDIRDHGSCSIGFTNVLRVVGWRTALPVLLFDVAKGYVPVWLCAYYVGPVWGGVCLLATAIGHAKSAYFFWKEGVFAGGKSVATVLGGILALQPAIAGLGLAVFLTILFATRIVSLGSMLAGISALALSFAFGLGTAWNIVFALVAVLILFTHRRNIARLIAGIEPKLGHRSEDNEAVSAFALHPLTFGDFAQMPITRWITRLAEMDPLPEKIIRRLIAMAPMLEAAEITGIRTLNGVEGRVLILAIPLLPDQIQDPKYRKVLNALLRSAAVQAQRRGASVLTLGALLSSYSGGGVELQTWCKKRGLTITIDNGAALTVAATVKAITNRGPIPLDQATVAVIGARGLIGRRVTEELEGRAKKVISLAREKSSDGQVLSLDLSELNETDIVVTATSSPGLIITRDSAYHLKPGALVVDVAVPPDVDDTIVKVRPDVILVRSGLILLPGEPRIGTDFHFGQVDTPNGPVRLVPACLAQGLALAVTREFQHASRGARVRKEDVRFFAEQLEKMGLTVITSDLSEPTVFGRTL